MESNKYRKKRCPKCKKLVSVNGVAWDSHMRSHERKAKKKQKIKAKKDKEVIINLREHPYAIIGDKAVGGQPPKTWEIPNLHDEFPPIRSLADYFITTGEATVKIAKYIEHLHDRLKKAQMLKRRMLKSKGASKYLETTWDENKLICKQKDPRKRS